MTITKRGFAANKKLLDLIHPGEILAEEFMKPIGQVFDALSYYSDHQDEINAHIGRNRIPDELIDPLVHEQ